MQAHAKLARGREKAARRNIFAAPPACYGGIFLCVILRWQPLQRETEDALFKVQKGFLPALHDEAVENIAHGEQKFF